MSEPFENDRWSFGSAVYSFSINWDGSKWITIIYFTLWHDLCLKHSHPPFLWSFSVICFDSCESVYCHFNEKTLLFKFPWLELRFKSFLELHAHFKGLCLYACANCIQKARSQLIYTIDAKLCSHWMFQNSFRNTERQNNFCNFLDDRLELWPSLLGKERAGLWLVDWSASHRTCFLWVMRTAECDCLTFIKIKYHSAT